MQIAQVAQIEVTAVRRFGKKARVERFLAAEADDL